ALYGLTAAMALIAEQSDLYAGLSVVRTYAARHDEFWQLFGEHCTLAAVSLLAAATLGMALGSLTAGRPGWGNLVEKLLTLSQTIPTISLLALFVSTAFIAGLSGLGPAPAVAALALYAMFPVTTATRSGLGQIRLKYAPSATALGLKGWQRLLFIELPLAGGTLLSGIRTAVNQTVGGAVLAAYVGAGGLGVYVMSGVIQSSPDLILLGTIPIGFLLLAGDGLLVAAIAIWQQRIGDRL
ncbi:MAG: ABC transporter permease subunit, partial [Negativicutes bacterium]|nr:ABC transporter permease subunit [Negativicutes bacterium]